jgi:NAD(P)-dependent dehydrogenase (short-subunit alcohol dehydrogenase family)
MNRNRSRNRWYGSRRDEDRSGGSLLRAAAVTTAAALIGRAVLRRSRYTDVRGKVVLITGGSRGLGLVLARQLADRGARLAICARDPDELDRARKDLRYRAADCLAVECDVTSRPQVNGMIEGVLQHFGRIDVLINNAGLISVGPVETMTFDDYAVAMNTHFYAPLFTTLAVLPHMKQRRFGRIVNISSIGGLVPAPHLLPYTASKFALSGFSQGLRAEVLKDNIYVTTVFPGLMRTGSPRNALFKGRHQEEYAWFATMDTLPLTSIPVTRAARQIIDAFTHGQSNAVLSLQAKGAAVLHAILPSLTNDVAAVANQILPSPGGIGRRRARGYQSESVFNRSSLSEVTRQAAAENNEIPNPSASR